jgi:hypothetical protein
MTKRHGAATELMHIYHGTCYYMAPELFHFEKRRKISYDKQEGGLFFL